MGYWNLSLLALAKKTLFESSVWNNASTSNGRLKLEDHKYTARGVDFVPHRTDILWRRVNGPSFLDLSLGYMVVNAGVTVLLAGFGAWFLTLLGDLQKQAKWAGVGFMLVACIYPIMAHSWYENLATTVPELDAYTSGSISIILLFCIYYLLRSERVQKTLTK